MVRIRLQRRGKKDYATYAIVVADSRAPRDGRFIEKLGIYDPNTYPETIDLNVERAVYWLGVGAQPSDTARSLLRKAGALYLRHLMVGVRKGALTEEDARKKFEEWKKKNDEKLRKIKEEISNKKKAEAEKMLEFERKIAQKRAEEIAAKFADKAAEEAEANAEEAPAAEEEKPAEE